MRLSFLFVILFLLAGESIFSQTYQQLRDSAAVERGKKDYKEAFNLLSEGISAANGYPYHNDLYDAAALAALTGQVDTAIYYLRWLVNVGEYDMVIYDARNDSDLKSLQSDNKWWKLYEFAMKIKNNETIRVNSSIVSSTRLEDSLSGYTLAEIQRLIRTTPNAKQLYQELKEFRKFPGISRLHDDDLLTFPVKINDSTYSFYEVQLPLHYNPLNQYAVLFDLHGAVFMNTGFPDPRFNSKHADLIKGGMNHFFSEYGYREDMIVVYPNANQDFNWMYPDDGFQMVNTILKDLKHFCNIDDNRVYLSGHSNGATGVISYLLKDPSNYAGFYGFNSNPRIRTGGTFIKNAKNRSYFNVATDKDYYFPISGHDTLTNIAQRMGIDWQNHVYFGFPHWFPQFKESEPAFKLMFADIKRRIRDPFHHNIYWECDDIRHGRCDWLAIKELDTTSEKKAWQTEINFPVTHWINNRDTSKVSDTIVNAFHFPRRSGVVKANYNNNIFNLTTSRVRLVSLYLSPEMINFSKPIIVFVNGEKVFDKKMEWNKGYMISDFLASFDRKAIWVNEIKLTIP